MWAGIYNIVEGVSPGSFSGTSETVDLIYFSFVTLTTLEAYRNADVKTDDPALDALLDRLSR
jgi:hypothetical protein